MVETMPKTIFENTAKKTTKLTVQDYLPQRPPILLIDEILTHRPDYIACKIHWHRHSFFMEQEEFSSVALIEMIAQSSAILQSLYYAGKGAPGFLTSVKKFSFYASPMGETPLIVEVQVQSTVGRHQIVQGSIYQETILLAEGLVYLYNA